jgi:hypothetical protein
MSHLLFILNQNKNMANRILSKLFTKKDKKNQITKLFTDDDKYLTLKVLPLPVKASEVFTVVLNEEQALGF